MIPRSASWSRMRSDAAKSRRLRAAWRSATRASISASLSAAEPWPNSERAELLRVVIAQHGKDRVERFHHVEHRRGIALAEFAAVHRRVGVAHQIEDRRERLRGVQIVREAAVELILRFCGALRNRWRRSFRKFFGAKARQQNSAGAPPNSPRPANSPA